MHCIFFNNFYFQNKIDNTSGQTLSISGNENLTSAQNNTDAYDSVSLNTAMIFEQIGQRRKNRTNGAVPNSPNFDSISMVSFGVPAPEKIALKLDIDIFKENILMIFI